MDTDLSRMTPATFRRLCREGKFHGPTSGLCSGFAQANLVIVPAAAANDFKQFCELNAKPCPLLEMTGRGDPLTKKLAVGADLRTDLPRYRVFVDGECVAEPTEIHSWWRDDLVAFLLGCSFTFENALSADSVPVRHWEERRADGGTKNVPMYVTNVPCRSAGLFSGNLVVSMRPMTPEQADQATRITFEYPTQHGAPVHRGDPDALGINDLDTPDFGDAVTIHSGELPVFWACGVTPQLALARAELPLAITHAPGHMFISDVREESFRVRN